MLARDRLVVALDRSSREELLHLRDLLSGSAGMFKIGLQAFIANGPSIVTEFTGRGSRVFLDLKLHDIPNTVRSAAAEASRLGASLLTIHAAGGAAMIEAAANAVASNANRPKILAVTMLTSIGDDDLGAIGVCGTLEENVVRLAHLAKQSGADGVVASPREIRLIREHCGDDFIILAPGIRSVSDSSDDQKRTMNAADAVRAGATYIVVGRPITGAGDPRVAAENIVSEMSRPE